MRDQLITELYDVLWRAVTESIDLGALKATKWLKMDPSLDVYFMLHDVLERAVYRVRAR